MGLAGRIQYTLLSNHENLSLDGRKSLKTLLAANKRLNTAYLLKESFGQLWNYNRERWARRFFDNWRAALKWLTDGILLGAEENALSPHLLPIKKQRATIRASLGGALGPRASSFAQGFGGQVKRILSPVHRSFSEGGSAPHVKLR